MPSFSVYRNAVTPSRVPGPGDLVFLRVDKLAGLAADTPELTAETVYRRGPIALLRMHARDDPAAGAMRQ
jgi:hypothetical protein